MEQSKTFSTKASVSRTDEIWKIPAFKSTKKDEGGTDNWGQLKVFSGSDITINAHFGCWVSKNGDNIVVGANNKKVLKKMESLYEPLIKKGSNFR